ncbi:hypothetical protein GYMLUDRAFT_665176 [Collybiopsis luxurians FD-317 M1]|uniref:Unplaced genomic scaffold GYMLUscaffold_30, whole genome shotgun sequence n=1 Tax=Collybiopsis luxurians FD-317 M1 TaxID=944289 RepID=A0A0D0CV80_9AGAR|nr:hypothetical protein GYMLUDRAFT_665176 [Collybiopsis luxurians FD-317 M1]
MYPPHMSAPTPAPSYPLNPVSQASKSFLTPLRKHHKLLKDGSGLEVWPEFVEQIFVQGLQAYSSTTASYNHSVKAADSRTPGRSRLRNAFLVSYLKERGIIRSRKQVASHLQVLKNMWKVDDNPNYYLVAGSEPLSPPLGHSSISENASTANHIPSRHPSPAFSSTSSTSSSSSSPSCMMGSPGMRSLVAVSSAYSSPCSSLQSSPLETQQSLETGPVAQLSQRPSHSATASMPARSEYLRVPMTTARQLGQAPIDASGFMSNQCLGVVSNKRQCQLLYVISNRNTADNSNEFINRPLCIVAHWSLIQSLVML